MPCCRATALPLVKMAPDQIAAYARNENKMFLAIKKIGSLLQFDDSMSVTPDT